MLHPFFCIIQVLKVKLVNIDNDSVYSVTLPLVSNKKYFATKFQSFPTPNRDNNITIQVKVQGSSLFISLTGHVIDLPNQCLGTNSKVCSPMPIRRDNLKAH